MKTLFRAVPFLLALLAVAACSDGGAQTQTADPAAPPPMPVKVIEARAENLPITNELPGRVAPTRIAEVRPRVSGIVTERVFEQGSLVKEGDVLYRIDPAQFQVQVDSARATLQRAQAVQLQAQQSAGRQQQ